MSTFRRHRNHPAVTTGIAALDACLDGPRTGEVALIAGEGAAQAAVLIAITAARAGQPTFFFSRNLDACAFRSHVVAALAGLPVEEVLRLDGRRARIIDEAALARIDLPLYHVEDAWGSAHDIAAHVAPAWFVEGSPLVVVDDVSHLDADAPGCRMQGESASPSAPRRLRAVAGELAHAARVLDAALLVCAPTDDGSLRAAEAASCLAMLADAVLIAQTVEGEDGRIVRLAADRVPGASRASIDLDLSPSRDQKPCKDTTTWGAFALRESA